MPTQSREALKHIALAIAGLCAIWGMGVMGWCALKSIYIDVPLLVIVSNIVTGIISSITTLLVGRTLSQLNQSADTETTVRQTTETVTVPKTPKPTEPQEVIVTNKPSDPVPVETQLES